MKLSIEMSDINSKGYGHIHKAGCRDLRDPETLGNAETRTEAITLAEDLTGWDHEPDEWHFAPCADLR